MDNILLFGSDKTQHNEQLHRVLHCIQSVGVILNPEKYKIWENTTDILRSCVVDETKIRADPNKTSAIVKMKAPANVPEIRRFMGMTN